MKNHSLYSKILSAVFLVLLTVMTLFSVFLPDRNYSETEKRALQTMPSLTLDALITRNQEDKFTQKYENYVADQFLLRNDFVSFKNNAELLLGKRDMNGIYIGNDGYLFSKETSFDQTRFDANLAAVKTFFENIQENGNVENFAFSLAPDSSHILAEKLPLHASVYSFDVPDRLAEEHFSDDYVSLKDPLLSHKSEDIYYKTDHHWTTLGAYYGYEAICENLGLQANKEKDYDKKVVSENFFGTYKSKVNISASPDTITRYDLKNTTILSVETDGKTHDSIYNEAALNTSDQYNFFLYGNYPLTKITTSNQNGRTLLVIKDSYAHSMIPFLCDHYETILCVDLRHYHESTLKLCKNETVTDVLVLYQATNFAKDSSLIQLTLS